MAAIRQRGLWFGKALSLAARIGADIDDSLGRLRYSHAALHYLHRDDPRVPVGEIMDAFNAEIKRGRLRYLGASDWSVERIEQANDYTREKLGAVRDFLAALESGDWPKAGERYG